MSASLKFSQGRQLERGRKPRVKGRVYDKEPGQRDLCCYFASNDAEKLDIILIEALKLNESVEFNTYYQL